MAEKDSMATISLVSLESQDARSIIFEDDITFVVSLVPLEEKLYRLGTTPLTSDELAYFGDIIEAEVQENGVLRFLRVVKPSLWHHWSWILPENVLESAELGAFIKLIEEYGGAWERYFGGFFLVHLSPEVPFNPETELQKVIRTIQAKERE